MAPPPRVAPGQILEDRFEILEQVGKGGMSTVYKAKDLDNEGVLVAVKVPLPMFASGVGSWSMFQREAVIGEGLQHPSLLRFVPTTTGKRRNYVVTEYVEGAPLDHLVGGGRHLDERAALDLMSRLCDAVGYLHARGFVHYDLKPGNVIVANDGSIRVIDFGMAHEIVRARFGFVGSAPPIASSDYVAPEQIRRKRGQPSVDIYALGAMLYEMLTGVPPFEHDDPFVIASARQIGDPQAPRALAPGISREVEEIVLRALRRDPLERYSSVAELRADVDNPTGVRVSGLAEHLVPVTPWRRHLRLARYIAFVGLTPVALLVASFRLLWWFLARKP